MGRTAALVGKEDRAGQISEGMRARGRRHAENALQRDVGRNAEVTVDAEPPCGNFDHATACLAGGAVLAVFFVRQLMVTTGIGPTFVEISEHPLLPGGQYRLYVSQAGRLKMRSLDVALVCEEEATYRQGTNTRTESREVCRQPLLHREEFQVLPGEPFATECVLRVPAGAMHSFKAAHNEVQWRIVVQGDVADWPEFRRSFPVIVHPSGARSAV